MALVAEDGTGLPGATTFATRAELIAFAAARGITIPDTDASDVFLVNAMDVLYTFEYIGNPVILDQALPFPRTYYPSPDSDTLGFPNDSVPAGVKRAQLLLAMASSRGIALLEVTGAGRQLKSRDVGPLKRSYDSGSLAVAQVTGVDASLAPYLAGGAGFRLISERR